MPVMPANTLQANLVIRTLNAVRRSKLFYQFVTPVPLTEHYHVRQCANAIHEKLSPVLAPLLSTTTIFDRVECRWWAPGVEIEAPSNNSGTPGLLSVQSNADAMPDEVTLMFRKTTGKPGRANKGRMFISGFGEQVQQSGKIDSLFRTKLLDFANMLTVGIDVVHPPNQNEPESMTGQLALRHWNRANNTMQPVVKCFAIDVVTSRADRRRPLELGYVVPAPA